MPPPPPDFQPQRLPLLLLLLALSTLFLYSADKGSFYRPGAHDLDTLKNMGMAENLSPDHHFRLFRARYQGLDGAPTYQTYSRFPVGGYALVKLAILPFGNDLSAKILAARILMLLLFSAAAVLAFRSLARITSRPWVALAATLMAFSSYYMLFYGDAVTTEGSVDLFAVMLAFHGMTVFVQEGRFPQLLAKTGVALLLGWHVYAFLLPFLILGLARETVRTWKQGTAPRLRSAAAAVLRSRYTVLGLAALLFGAALLSFNFANEYAASRGETPVTELQSFQSMLRRTGLDQDSASFGWWLRFLQQQFFRVCVASVPFVLSDWGAGLLEWFPSLYFAAPEVSGPRALAYILALLTAVGAAAALVRLAGPLLEGRQRLLLAALALSGFCWALPMRHNAGFNHEALFYLGVPLVFYSLLLLYVHERWGHGPVAAFAAAALLAFAVSAFRMDRQWGPDAHAAELQQSAMAELGAIRETTRGKAVMILESVNPEPFAQATWVPHVSHGWTYYLTGSILMRDPDMEAIARAADFIVTYDRVESDALLTPGNRQVFLYDSAGIDDLMELYRTVYRRVVSAGDPVARSYFDVYLGDDALVFVKDPCGREDMRPRGIFAYVTPEDPEGSLAQHKRYASSDDPSVYTYAYSMLFEGKCIAVLPLPDYPISRIRTGQNRRPLRPWTVEIDL